VSRRYEGVAFSDAGMEMMTNSDVGGSQLRRYLEFHDSKLLAVATDDGGARITIDAYIHRWEVVSAQWKGTGWMQRVQFQMRECVSAAAPSLPVEISDGEVEVQDGLFQNLIRLPSLSLGPVVLRLHVQTGETLEFIGRDLVVTCTGEAEFIEPLPDDLKPPDVIGTEPTP